MALRRLRSRAARVARLTAFLVVVAIGLQMLLGKVVRAQVDGALLDLGAGLAQLAGAADPGQPRVLEINGSSLHFDTATHAESVTEVLDQAEAGCSAEPAREGQLLRGGDGWRGFVACFARLGAVIGEAARPASGYRYVYAQPGSERTLVLRFWTDQALDLDRLFPASGDAPGSDAPGIPRPPRARRVLSARETSAPQQLTLYTTESAGPDELDAWYRERLAGLGWRPLETTGRTAPATRTLVVGRAGAIAALVFAHEESGGGSVAILTSL